MPDGKPDLSGYYSANSGGANYGLERHDRDFLTPGRLEKAAIGRRTTEGVMVRRGEPAGRVLDGGRPFLQLPAGHYRLDVRCDGGIPRMAAQPVLGIEIIARRRCWQ